MNCHSSVTRTSSYIGVTDNSALDFEKLLKFMYSLRYWSSPQKVVHLLVWEINPIRNMKGGLKWLRKDTNPKKS